MVWVGKEITMKPRISVITIGVDDLERSVAFYREGLGLSTEGIVGTQFEYGAVAFFGLQSGLQLAVWPRSSIARDSGMRQASPSPTEFTLGHNVATREEVHAVMQQAKKAGAVIANDAHDTSGAAMPATFKITMIIFGRLPGMPAFKSSDAATRNRPVNAFGHGPPCSITADPFFAA
jgi:uncharacterized protein